MSFGLYVHVPFCTALCPYCDFAVVVGRDDLHARYLDAVVEEARANAWGAEAESVFVGGGTPTAVDAATLARALRALRGVVPVAHGAEVSIEANPETVDEPSLRALREAGVNRVSIGAQSFDDTVLRALGRTHVASDTAAAVDAARAAGFARISLDLIYGGPGETDGAWRATLESAVALGPEHVSCYGLTIEDRTPFGGAVARGEMSSPDEDTLAARYETAVDVLAAAGYEHYELSNWARPGAECRHNLLYWAQGDYLGLGLGAHSHRDGRRWWNDRSLPRYLAAPAEARAGEERLVPRARAEEWLTLSLRLVRGVDLAEAARRLGSLPVDALVADGLATVAGGRLRLTRRGMLLENVVAGRLIDAGGSAGAGG